MSLYSVFIRQFGLQRIFPVCLMFSGQEDRCGCSLPRAAVHRQGPAADQTDTLPHNGNSQMGPLFLPVRRTVHLLKHGGVKALPVVLHRNGYAIRRIQGGDTDVHMLFCLSDPVLDGIVNQRLYGQRRKREVLGSDLVSYLDLVSEAKLFHIEMVFDLLFSQEKGTVSEPLMESRVPRSRSEKTETALWARSVSSSQSM